MFPLHLETTRISLSCWECSYSKCLSILIGSWDIAKSLPRFDGGDIRGFGGTYEGTDAPHSRSRWGRRGAIPPVLSCRQSNSVFSAAESVGFLRRSACAPTCSLPIWQTLVWERNSNSSDHPRVSRYGNPVLVNLASRGIIQISWRFEKSNEYSFIVSSQLCII